MIRWRLSRLLLGVHRPAEALAQADAALAKSPGNPELLLIRARTLVALNDPGSLAAFRAALASAEGRSGPVFPTESARLQVIAAAELGRDARLPATRYRRALAQRLTDESRWEAALEEWERARSAGPLDAQGEFSRGRALDATGDHARAMEALRRAVVLDPARTAFRAHLAARLWENEQYMQAIFEWQTIIGQEPGNVDAHVALARAYLKSGNRASAVGEYRRVLALLPGHSEARQALTRLSAAP
jgi:tetratricopeptide (TPR) repeat protein